MNKLTKGAIATAAGVILLMGGAGTLASWNSNSAVGAGQAIVAGSLALNQTGSPANVWASQAGTISNITNYRIVPGDVVTYTATYNLVATGDNLKFTVGTTAGSITAATAGAADVALAGKLASTAGFTVTGTNITQVSGNTYKVASNSGASTVTIVMTLTYDSAATTGQLGNVTFGAGAITLTQV